MTCHSPSFHHYHPCVFKYIFFWSKCWQPLTPAIHSSSVIVSIFHFFLSLHTVQLYPQSHHFPHWHLNFQPLPLAHSYQNSWHTCLIHFRNISPPHFLTTWSICRYKHPSLMLNLHPNSHKSGRHLVPFHYTLQHSILGNSTTPSPCHSTPNTKHPTKHNLNFHLQLCTTLYWSRPSFKN